MVRLDGNTDDSSVGGVVALQVIEVREGQPAKAQSPMLFTPLPIVTEVREEQPLKELSSMFVTLFGIVIEVSEVQS